MPVPQMDPGAFYRAHAAEVGAAVARVVASGRYMLGPEVESFERAFAAFCGAAHAVGVANGTDAVALALRAAGVKPGDRVATVSHTAVATVAAIELIGAIPVLLDIDAATYTLEPDQLMAVLPDLPPVKAVVAVHLYGQPADAEALARVVARHDAVLVEDCAQAHGARLRGRAVGSAGVAAAFSFYPTKNLGALGDAGAVVTNDVAAAERVRALRQYGWRGDRRDSELPGVNSRLDELQAAFLNLRLMRLARQNARRRAIAARYDRGLADCGVTLPVPRAGAEHVYHQYVIRHPQRDALRGRLAAQGVLTNVHYPVPVHLQPAYAGRVAVAPGGLPQSEAAAREVLSLPMFPELDDDAVEHVIDAVRRLA
jgi:hypothetical protein